MISTAERDQTHCLLILELIDHIERRMEDQTYERFASDRDEIDLTAFRLAAIGESSHKLSDEFKARWPDVPWREIYTMRNIISHDYGRIDIRRVWETANENLGGLIEACRSGAL